MNEALGHLLQVVQLENQWKLFPGGKVAFTQEEETGYAIQHARAVIDTDLKAMRPLKAEAFVRNYKPIFPSKELTPIQASIDQTGKKHCQELSREVVRGRPYFGRWVSSYCQFWGESLGKKAAAQIDPVSGSLYSDVKLAVKGEGLPPEVVAELGVAVDQALMRTPWYDPEGKHVVQASVSGSFSQAHTKNGVILIHNYQEQERFVERVPVERTRQVFVTEWVQVTDPTTGETRTVPEEGLREERYTDYEDEVRYRPVDRSFRYPAWKHEQQMSLQLAGQFVVNERALEASLNERSAADGIEHDENHPEMGLKPSRPSLPVAATWQKEQIARFAEAFRAQAAQLWRASFCDVDATSVRLADSGDRVARCMRFLTGGEPVPAFAEEWFVKNVGVGAAQAVELVERGPGARKM
jgi:hypothetical protein